MQLLPKSPLDSSLLGRGRGEGAVIFRKVIRSQRCSLKKRKVEEEGKGEREGPIKLKFNQTTNENKDNAIALQHVITLY
jgi:hypothetical protein